MDCLDQLVYYSEQGIHSEKNQIIAVQQHWNERTLSRKDNHRENLLEVEWNLLRYKRVRS